MRSAWNNVYSRSASAFRSAIGKTYSVNQWACRGFLVLQVLVSAYVVFGRFVLRSTPGWGSSLILFSLVWFSLLSVSLGIRDEAHVRLQIVDYVVPLKWQKYVGYVNHFFALLFGILMTVGGTIATISVIPNNMPGLEISRAWLFLSIPISGVLILLSLIDKGAQTS